MQGIEYLPANTRNATTRILRLFSFAVVFSSPFSVWFSLTPILRFPLLITTLCLGLSLLIYLGSLSVPEMRLNSHLDPLIVLFGGYIIVSATLQFGGIAEKTFTHAIVRNAVVVVFYFGWRFLFDSARFTSQDLVRAAFFTALLVDAIVIVDGGLANFAGVMIRDWFIISDTGNAPYFPRIFWMTPTSPCEEPGTTAFFSSVLWAIGMRHLRTLRGGGQVAMWIVHSVAIAFLLSSAGLVYLAISLGSFILLMNGQARRLLLILASVGALVFSPLLYKGALIMIDATDILSKVTLSNRNESAGTRMHTWHVAAESFYESPLFGKGVGYGNSLLGNGFHGILAGLFSETGLFGVLIVVFQILVMIYLISFQPPDARILSIGILLVLVVGNSIADYYYTPIDWIFPVYLTMRNSP